MKNIRQNEVENPFFNLGKIIDQLGRDKGIDKQLIVDAVTQGLLEAAKKKYGTYREIEAQYNEKTGEIELFEFKEVVSDEKLEDDLVEITLSEAKKLDEEAEIGESIGVNLDTKELGRIAAQTARQIIFSQVQSAEREVIFSEFEQRKGEIASGIIRREDRGGALVVDLGRTEAYMLRREQIPGEMYKPGDRIQGFISDVRQSTRGLQIIISRAHEGYLRKLFEQEVPEVDEGIVEIVVAAREPGQRAKVAVRTKDSNVDPVGACVGMKGSRVQNVIQELKGERIDIIVWDDDPAVFISRALSPAEVSKVFMDVENKEMEVVVPDEKLSLAIGKKGQNVRLASRLSGWKLDITSESQMTERKKASVFNLMLLPGMSDTMAQNLFQYGFGSFSALAESQVEDLKSVPGYDTPEKASELIQKAKDLVEKYKKEGEPIPQYSPEKKSEEAPQVEGDAKLQAEQRLKSELGKLEKGQQPAEEEKKELKPETSEAPEEKASQESTQESEEKNEQEQTDKKDGDSN